MTNDQAPRDPASDADVATGAPEPTRDAPMNHHGSRDTAAQPPKAPTALPTNKSQTGSVEAGADVATNSGADEVPSEEIDGGGPVIEQIVIKTRRQLALIAAIGFFVLSTIYLLALLFSDVPDNVAQISVILGGFAASFALVYRHYFGKGPWDGGSGRGRR